MGWITFSFGPKQCWITSTKKAQNHIDTNPWQFYEISHVPRIVATAIGNSLLCHKCITSEGLKGGTRRRGEQGTRMRGEQGWEGNKEQGWELNKEERGARNKDERWTRRRGGNKCITSEGLRGKQGRDYQSCTWLQGGASNPVAFGSEAGNLTKTVPGSNGKMLLNLSLLILQRVWEVNKRIMLAFTI